MRSAVVHSYLKRGLIFFVCVAVFFLLALVVGLQHAGAHQIVFTTVNGQRVISIPQESKYWQQRIKEIGGKQSYAEAVALSEPLPLLQQHIMGHIIGEALFDIEGINAMPICGDELNPPGCIHSFVGRALQTYGIAEGTALVQKTCESVGGKYRDGECAHSVGHGILNYIGYNDKDLQKGLTVCDTAFGRADLSQDCANGVVMEYDLRLLASTGTDAGIGRPISAAELYHPCDQIPDKFVDTCFLIHPLWWFTNLQDKGISAGVALMGNYCRALPANISSHRESCFDGIGLSLPYLTHLDTVAVARACSKVSPEVKDRLTCWRYAVSNLPEEEVPSQAHLVCGGLQGPHEGTCLNEVSLIRKPAGSGVSGPVPIPIPAGFVPRGLSR